MCFSSSERCTREDDKDEALENNVLTTERLCAKGWWELGRELKVLMCVCSLSKYRGRDGSIIFFSQVDIKKRQLSILLYLAGELNRILDVVKVPVEVFD